jgi:hypothetical protein
MSAFGGKADMAIARMIRRQFRVKPSPLSVTVIDLGAGGMAEK